MATDPSNLGYDRVTIPGYSVARLLGTGADCVVMDAESINAASARRIKRAAEERVVTPFPPDFVIHPVPGHGNSFLYAVADQLRRAGEVTPTGSTYTHDALKVRILSRVVEVPSFGVLGTGDENLKGWVDLPVVASLASALNVNIAIYGVTLDGDDAPIRIDRTGEYDRATPGRPTLRLLYNGTRHYDSLVDIDAPAPTAQVRARSGTQPLAKRQREAEEPAAARKQARLSASTFSAPTRSKALVSSPPGKVYNLRKEPAGGLMSSASNTSRGATDTPPQRVAVKIYKKARSSAKRDHEEDIFNKMKLSYHVPSVVATATVLGMPAIVLHPVATPVHPATGGVRLSRADFIRLVHVLQHAHDLGFCHRDVKLSNILKDGDRILLIDWSSAAYTDVSVAWEGTRPFYEDKHGQEYAPRPEEDLVALVRSVYVMYTGDTTYDGLVTRMESSRLWHRALEYAARLDYDRVKKVFNEL
jgi:hypothetical protein